MKKSILSLILLTISVSIHAQTTQMNSDVHRQWRTKTIRVVNGGKTPDIVTLLRAFHQEHPTWVVGEVLDQADHPAKGTRQSGTASILEAEDDYRILIDRRNGYADLQSETDID